MLSREKLPPIKNPKLNHYHSCLSLVYLVPQFINKAHVYTFNESVFSKVF